MELAPYYDTALTGSEDGIRTDDGPWGGFMRESLSP